MLAGGVSGGSSVGVVVVVPGIGVGDVAGDELFELLLVPDDGAVEQFSADRSDPSLGERARDRCSDGCLENFESLGSEGFVERGDEQAPVGLVVMPAKITSRVETLVKNRT
jgi:hypothetical protein